MHVVTQTLELFRITSPLTIDLQAQHNGDPGHRWRRRQRPASLSMAPPVARDQTWAPARRWGWGSDSEVTSMEL